MDDGGARAELPADGDRAVTLVRTGGHDPLSRRPQLGQARVARGLQPLVVDGETRGGGELADELRIVEQTPAVHDGEDVLAGRPHERQRALRGVELDLAPRLVEPALPDAIAQRELWVVERGGEPCPQLAGRGRGADVEHEAGDVGPRAAQPDAFPGDAGGERHEGERLSDPQGAIHGIARQVAARERVRRVRSEQGDRRRGRGNDADLQPPANRRGRDDPRDGQHAEAGGPRDGEREAGASERLDGVGGARCEQRVRRAVRAALRVRVEDRGRGEPQDAERRRRAKGRQRPAGAAERPLVEAPQRRRREQHRPRRVHDEPRREQRARLG